MPSQKHNPLKSEPAKLRRRNPRAWTVPAIDHNLLTPLRRDFAGARSDFGKRNIDSGWHVTQFVLRASADVEHNRSVWLPQTPSEFVDGDTFHFCLLPSAF
jgi:hypothetical protein